MCQRVGLVWLRKPVRALGIISGSVFNNLSHTEKVTNRADWGQEKNSDLDLGDAACFAITITLTVYSLVANSTPYQPQ